MKINNTIVIVGAPRSGTSLIQKIFRESPAAVSVPHESSVIWNKLIHPENNNWKYEGACLSSMTLEEKELMRQAFHNKAMNNNTWVLWSKLGLMRRPFIAKYIRWLYPRVHPLISGMLRQKNTKGRLIEKTVHGGLWMDIIDEVLDKPMFIHITRDGVKTIQSMTNAWSDSERFGCYLLPKKIKYQKNDFKNTWCFPLVKNWERICDRPIYEIATFQWLQIQKSILEYSEKLPKEQYIRIKLEHLVGQPGCLLGLLNSLDMPLNEYFKKYLTDMPKINVSEKAPLEFNSLEENWVTQEIHDVQKQLGY